MPTNTTNRAETRSISIAAPPSAALDVVGDARRLPEWAPRFARSVRPVDHEWLVDTGAGDLRIDVRVSRDAGTVDLVRGDPLGGAFMRVVPNHHGSELLFTLFFPAGTPDEATDRQMATVEDELRTVRDLAEAVVAA
jgi:hypothetical protein